MANHYRVNRYQDVVTVATSALSTLQRLYYLDPANVPTTGECMWLVDAAGNVLVFDRNSSGISYPATATILTDFPTAKQVDGQLFSVS